MVKFPNIATNAMAAHYFMAAFGAPDTVKNEIKAYWTEKGFTHPRDLYDHLLDIRVQDGRITRERADILKAIFHDTYQPEQVTGYDPKHRVMLVNGLADEYVKMFPDRPLIRMELDIGNLGMMNKALEDAALDLQNHNLIKFKACRESYPIADTLEPQEQAKALGHVLADRLMGIISGIVHESLSEVAAVSIENRKGGDELGATLQLKPGLSIEAVETALEAARQKVETVIAEAKLDTIDHSKKDGAPGVSIGFSAVEINDISEHSRQTHLDIGILLRKAENRTRGKTRQQIEMHLPTVEAVGAAIVTNKRFICANTAAIHPASFEMRSGLSPYKARYVATLLHLQNVNHGRALNREEKTLLRGTYIISQKHDPVTHLPTFDTMEREIRPHFTYHHGNGRLVHIDFSNAAGGNMLHTSIGDAIIKQDAEAVRLGLKSERLEKFWHYTAIKPGGKFVVLLPATVSTEKLTRLEHGIRKISDRLSRTPLSLPAEVMKQAQAVAASEAYEQKTGSNPFRQRRLCVADIPSPKPDARGLHGVQMTFAASGEALDPSLSLGVQLKPLELETAAKYNELLNRHQRLRGDSHVTDRPGESLRPYRLNRPKKADEGTGRASGGSEAPGEKGEGEEEYHNGRSDTPETRPQPGGWKKSLESRELGRRNR